MNNKRSKTEKKKEKEVGVGWPDSFSDTVPLLTKITSFLLISTPIFTTHAQRDYFFPPTPERWMLVRHKETRIVVYPRRVERYQVSLCPGSRGVYSFSPSSLYLDRVRTLKVERTSKKKKREEEKGRTERGLILPLVNVPPLHICLPFPCCLLKLLLVEQQLPTQASS